MSAPESWEDMDEGNRHASNNNPPPTQQSSGFHFNANAPTFSFNPTASSFTPSYGTPLTAPVPPGYYVPGPQIYAGSYNGYNPNPGYGAYNPGYVAPPPPGYVAVPQQGLHQSVAATSQPREVSSAAHVQTQHSQQPQQPQQQQQPQQPRKAVVVSIGGPPPKVSDEVSSKVPEAAEEVEESWEKPDVDDVKAKSNKENVTDTEITKVTEKMEAVKTGESKTEKAPEKLESVATKDEETDDEHEIPEKLKESLSDTEEETDTRDHMNLVFIGHVDAGKSTIGGQILYLSGQVDKRTIEKFEREAKDKNRESWYMAYIMDTNEEERAKGKTVEVGRAHFETEKRRYTVLDAPGHKNYVPNMISGASQADVGVLVLAARKGEFETGFERGGQTREHAQLAKTLGVSKLVVVVNKMDDPSVNWAKERFDDIVTKMTPFLKQCGYNTKKDVQFLPISGLLGANMKEKVKPEVCPWWTGPTFFETLDALEMPLRDPSGPFRMPLIDKYRDMGTVVMGKIESGSVRRGDTLLVMPNRQQAKVVTIFRDDDEVSYAKPGENLRVRLSGVEEEDILPGFVLSAVKNPIASVVEFDAQLQILELLDHKAIFTAGYKAILHIHAVVEECEIIELLQQMDPKTKKWMKKKPLFVKSNAIVMVRLQVAQTICVEKFSSYPQLGRFTLRDEGKTVAIGKVTALVGQE